MPSSFRYDGRDINTDRYLILHEEVKKTLIAGRGACSRCPVARLRPLHAEIRQAYRRRAAGSARVAI
jgi:hypothetical protein